MKLLLMLQEQLKDKSSLLLKKFRVKGLPKPEGAILRTTGAVKLAKQNILAGEVSVAYNDFDFDLTTKVNSFRILVPGQPKCCCSRK